MNSWDIFFTVELFFGAVLFGLVVSLIISYFFNFYSLSTQYELEYNWALKEKNEQDQKKFKYLKNKVAFPLYAYLVIIILFTIYLLFAFTTFADITNQIKNTENVNENPSCCNATEMKNYSLTVNQITVNPQHDELSIKELQYLLNKKHPCKV